jgi:rSAM/selenodomain-associated transferase 1
MSRTAVVLAKAPRPGRVKTRLCPPLTLDEAAAVAAAALADTLAAVGHADCQTRLLALDELVPWLRPAGWRRVRQAEGSLGDRLAALFAALTGPVVLVGMDTPQLTGRLFDTAFARLRAPRDAVLGLAEDGGYWLIGMYHPDPRVFAGVPMSTATTGVAQRERLAALGHRVATIDPLRDVDEWDDARAVAAAATSTTFAREVARLDARIRSTSTAEVR